MCKWNAHLILSEVEGSGPKLGVSLPSFSQPRPLAFRRRDDSHLVRQFLHSMRKGHQRRSALLRQTINAISLALEPAIEIVQENLADIGHEPGGAQHRDLRRAVAREELGAAQRLLAVGGDDGNAP